jgi:hypothetical protein
LKGAQNPNLNNKLILLLINDCHCTDHIEVKFSNPYTVLPVKRPLQLNEFTNHNETSSRAFEFGIDTQKKPKHLTNLIMIGNKSLDGMLTLL